MYPQSSIQKLRVLSAMLITSLHLYALVHCSVDAARLYSRWEEEDGHRIAGGHSVKYVRIILPVEDFRETIASIRDISAHNCRSDPGRDAF